MNVTEEAASRYDGLTDATEDVKAELRELKAVRAELHQHVRKVDRVIERAERTLEKVSKEKPRRRPRPLRNLDPHVQAGVAAEVMLRVFRNAEGPITMAEAARRGDVMSGTSTWAIRALVEDGLIVPTGERHNRSNVYKLTKRGKARETTLAPGQ